MQDLGRAAAEILEVDATLIWRDPNRRPYHKAAGLKYDATHRDYPAAAAVLKKLKGKRRERATQLLYHLLAKNAFPAEPAQLEAVFHRCVQHVKKHHAAHLA